MIYFFMNVLVSNPPKLSTPAPLSHYNSYTHNNTTLHLSIYLSPVRKARKEAQSYYREYRETKPVGQLVKSTASVMQEYTQSGGVRPFGVSLLVAGMDGDGVPRLFQVDPSGAYFGWKATAIGKVRRGGKEGRDASLSYLTTRLFVLLGCTFNLTNHRTHIISFPTIFLSMYKHLFRDMSMPTTSSKSATKTIWNSRMPFTPLYSHCVRGLRGR